MKLAKPFMVGLLIAFIAIQFFQPGRNQIGQAGNSTFAETFSIPDTVHALFKNACFDCHSNNTKYPWYSNIQPVGWFLAQDIVRGKAKLNFDELGSLSLRRQISKFHGIENRIKDGTMPLASYQFMHPRARLSEVEERLIINWIETVIQTLDPKK